VKKDLADAGLLAEDWGGEVIMVPVSAKTRMGLKLLLENIALQSDVLELKANAGRPAMGVDARSAAREGPRPDRHRARAGRHAVARATPSCQRAFTSVACA
jgi:translation initiation factor IF-2